MPSKTAALGLLVAKGQRRLLCFVCMLLCLTHARQHLPHYPTRDNKWILRFAIDLGLVSVEPASPSSFDAEPETELKPMTCIGTAHKPGLFRLQVIKVRIWAAFPLIIVCGCDNGSKTPKQKNKSDLGQQSEQQSWKMQ